ncbi:MAG: hypothetical protein EBZ48_10130 [Proteobacteria bacterium]|nr:hypothetical protein [Pseudomonadota bacterium]
MTPLKTLRAAVTAFERLHCTYCLIGGHAASLYRAQARVTSDVDFALIAESHKNSRALAEQVITSLGLTPMLAFIAAGPREKGRKPICMVTSRPPPAEVKGIIDILLPELPWLPQAVARAQHNKIDLGFRAVPVITPEDLVIAKCYALRNAPDRFQDLDDLKEIFGYLKDLDIDYLRQNLKRLKLTIPTPLKQFAPKGLKVRGKRS